MTAASLTAKDHRRQWHGAYGLRLTGLETATHYSPRALAPIVDYLRRAVSLTVTVTTDRDSQRHHRRPTRHAGTRSTCYS